MAIAGAHILEMTSCARQVFTPILCFTLLARYFLFFVSRQVYKLSGYRSMTVFRKINRVRTCGATGGEYTVNAEYRFFQVDESLIFWYPYNIFTHKIIVY